MDSIIIRKINIRNFRSISKLEIDADRISILVGQNDAGKSNILRALNLFFNNETDSGVALDFQSDFYIGGSKERKADEISVELEFELPENYRDTNGDFLVWRKAWRKETTLPENSDYFGRRVITGARGGRKFEDIKIPAKSNLHATLKQINYRYVPATKNTDFFDRLRGEIYHTISNVAQTSIHRSSRAFETDISTHLSELTKELDASLGYESRLALPNDLSPIFEKLDFLNSEKIPLKNRGDGIKARHIPHILHFMALKQKSMGVRGGPRYTTIWGYEEPENNLEMSSCAKLAKEIFNYCDAGVEQIVLTTHSPIFYNVSKESQSYSNVHYIYKDEKEVTVAKSEKDITSLDKTMGVTAIYADKIKGLQEDLKRLTEEAESNLNQFKHLTNITTLPRIFVEGISDKIFLNKMVSVFHPQFQERIIFETKETGAGSSYVIDMLSHWRSRHKHHLPEAKAAGIVDGDAAQHKSDWNKIDGNVNSAKCFLLPKSPDFIGIDHQKFNLINCLEMLYPKAVWEHGKAQGWLEEVPKTKIFKDAEAEQILSGKKSAEDYITPQSPLFMCYKFKGEFKTTAANYVARQSEQFLRQHFEFVSAFLSEVFQYLGVEQ